MHDPGDVVTADFPGVMGIKRRPCVVISSTLYQRTRPDVILGLLQSEHTSGPSLHPERVAHHSPGSRRRSAPWVNGP